MTTTLKVLGALAVCALIFWAGYEAASNVYEKDIAELRQDYAERSQALEREYREKERTATEALAAAWQERDKALADAVDLRSDAERVHSEAAAAKRSLSRARAGTCQSERKQLARCADLLAEGVELGAEGSSLSQRVAIDKDALANISTP